MSTRRVRTHREVLDPEAVVIGGGLGLSGGAYWESMIASARKTIWSDKHRDVPIVRHHGRGRRDHRRSGSRVEKFS